MTSLNESKIDKKTELKLHNTSITNSTDDINEVNGNDFYEDLSNMTDLEGAQFIRQLVIECKKSSEYGNRVVYIPVNFWDNTNTQSPVGYISKAIRNNPIKFKEDFANITFIFVNTNTKENFALVINEYQSSQYNEFSDLLVKINPATVTHGLTGVDKKSPESRVIDQKKTEAKAKEKNKQELAKAVAIAADSGEDEEDIMSNEDVLEILAQVEADEKPYINKTRAARMDKVDKEFLASKIGDKTVEELLTSKEEEIPSAHLKVSTINTEEWDKLKFSNFENAYDINKDIYSMLYSLSSENKQYPVAIRSIEVEDTSTSMDYLLTYKAHCEDTFGQRFTLKFDIPKFINNRFMMLRGNEKSMSGQLMLLPCLKTDQDTVQIVSNYNKIFIRRYGMTGKSYPHVDRLSKSLNKYKGTKIKIIPGDNSLICTKYDLPVDYIDLASSFSKVETPDKVYFFDQDVYYSKYNADLSIGLPYAVDKKSKMISYYMNDNDIPVSEIIAEEIIESDEQLSDIYNATKAANRLSYSQASILANKIPLVVLLGYHIGLTELIKKANIEGVAFGRRAGENESSIKFADTNMVYPITYRSSMLLNGLSECDTRNYTLAEMDKRSTWLDFLDKFGGRILSDGLDNFKDLFMDPITIEVCNDCKLPTDYIELLIYANNLLVDNKYNRHTDITGNRYRTNEIVAAYFYIALGKSYEQYANAIRRGSKGPMTIKQTAVIDAILTSNISSDLSTLNPLLELTTANTATFKGPSGMNSDRAYGLDKRTYDDSMINKLALSTGFSANVGIDRLTTIDMDIEGTRGYIKNTNDDDMSVTKTFSMTEAVTPFGTVGETI